MEVRRRLVVPLPLTMNLSEQPSLCLSLCLHLLSEGLDHTLACDLCCKWPGGLPILDSEVRTIVSCVKAKSTLGNDDAGISTYVV